MRQANKRIPESAEKTVRDIRRATRRHHSAEEKIRILLEGLRGEDSFAAAQQFGRFRSGADIDRAAHRAEFMSTWPSRPLQPIRKDLVIRFRRQRLAREAIMAAKEISVKKYVVRLSGEERE